MVCRNLPPGLRHREHGEAVRGDRQPPSATAHAAPDPSSATRPARASTRTPSSRPTPPTADEVPALTPIPLGSQRPSRGLLAWVGSALSPRGGYISTAGHPLRCPDGSSEGPFVLQNGNHTHTGHEAHRRSDAESLPYCWIQDHRIRGTKGQGKAEVTGKR